VNQSCEADILLGLTLPQVLAILQIAIVAISAVIALRALRASARTARSDVQYKLLKEGRDLRIKYDEAARISDPATRTRTLDDLRGVIFSYYAGCFDLAEAIGLQEPTLKMLKADLKAAMRDTDFQLKWRKIADNFSRSFQSIVNE
jgi:hypothetical protein